MCPKPCNCFQPVTKSTHHTQVSHLSYVRQLWSSSTRNPSASLCTGSILERGYLHPTDLHFPPLPAPLSLYHGRASPDWQPPWRSVRPVQACLARYASRSNSEDAMVANVKFVQANLLWARFVYRCYRESWADSSKEFSRAAVRQGQ